MVTVPRGGVAEVPVRPFTGGRYLGGADSGSLSPKTSELSYRKSLFRNKLSLFSNPVPWITVFSTVSSKIFRKKIFTRSASTHRDGCRACPILFESHTVTTGSAHGIFIVPSYLADRRNWWLLWVVTSWNSWLVASSWRRRLMHGGLTVVRLDHGNRLFGCFVIHL